MSLTREEQRRLKNDLEGFTGGLFQSTIEENASEFAEDEVLQRAAVTEYEEGGWGGGVLVLTSERILWLQDKVTGGTETVSIPLSEVEAVEKDSGFFSDTITFRTSTENHVFKPESDHEVFDEIVKIVLKGIGEGWDHLHGPGEAEASSKTVTTNGEGGHVVEPPFRAEGANGQIVAYEDSIEIKREGVVAFLGHGRKGDKEIRISKISSVQFKDAGAVMNGFIQFSLSGGKEDTDGTWDATTDENTVMFSKASQPAFERVREHVRSKMREFDSTARDGQDRGSDPSDNMEALEKLGELKEKGLITEEEFQAKKQDLLDL